MEDYNKIIDSLQIKVKKVGTYKVLQHVCIKNFYDIHNAIFILHSGTMQAGIEETLLQPNDVLFVPGGKWAMMSLGSIDAPKINNEDFQGRKEKYIRSVKPTEQGDCIYSVISFEARAYDAGNFFSTLDIPHFTIDAQSEISTFARNLVFEKGQANIGTSRVCKLYGELMAIAIVRYITHNQIFLEQLATKNSYFKDERLNGIFGYIKKHLEKNLSNKQLAAIAGVSEDYVGQYFKQNTGLNPQDYIEYLRMEKAISLIRSGQKINISEIGTAVGYKDTAYFCRRFKMMFGISPGKMRSRDSLNEENASA